MCGLLNDNLNVIREALESRRRHTAELESINDYFNGAGYTKDEIARIDAALAALDEDAGWEVVPDGEVSSFMYVDNGGKLLGVYAGDDYTDWYATEDLPDHIRLCRKRPPAQG